MTNTCNYSVPLHADNNDYEHDEKLECCYIMTDYFYYDITMVTVMIILPTKCQCWCLPF